MAVRRFSVHRLVWLGIFGMAAGGLLIVIGRSPLVTIAGAFLLGLLGVLMALFNSALAAQHGEFLAVALTESVTMASLFSAIAPTMISFFARTPLSWRAGVWIFLFAAPVLWLVYGKNPIHISPALAGPAQPGQKTVKARLPIKARLPFIYWLFWALTFLVEAIEFCIIFWASDYLEKVLHFEKANAALGVSVFIGAMLVGRMLVSRLLRRSKELQLLTSSLWIATAGFLIFWLTPAGTPLSAFLVLAGLALAGLGIAGLIPMVNSLALNSAPQQMMRASSRLSLAIGSSILLMPLILGRLADWVGIRSAYALELGILAAAIGVAFWAGKMRPVQVPS
jgi:fucose permease